MDIQLAFVTVGVMLLYAVPGFIMMKAKMFGEETLRSLSKILMFVCQPCFTVYSFNQIGFSLRFLGQVLAFMAVIVVIQIVVIVLFFLIYRKKFHETKYRICTIASCFANCVFFGAPVLTALLPEFPEAIVFANAYAVAMNLLGWTLGSSIITYDKKYISLKKVLFNPGTVGFVVAVLLYCLDFKFTGTIENSLGLLGKMTTPISMMVLGMRLATVSLKPIFTTPLFYLTIIFKQMVYPIFGATVMSLLPFMSSDIIITSFILCACPVASIVLNFSELLGDGQETAADLFLLGTLSSIITMPLILCLV